MTNLFGWEMILKAVKVDMKKDADYIVAFAHWYLVQRANLRCLGNGKDMRHRNDETGSEMLPTDWNRNDKTYAMRYILNDNVYVLLGTISEDSFILNFLSADRMDLSNVTFHTETVVECIKATNCVISTDLQAIIDRFTEELLNPVFESDTRATGTQTVEQPPPPRSPPTSRPSSGMIVINPYREFDLDRRNRERERELLRVGRRDLDPFALGGGGMLFDPPRHFPPVRPHGGDPDDPWFPQGARFDPFGPPAANRNRPNNDHFRPPQFDQANNDDMFM